MSLVYVFGFWSRDSQLDGVSAMVVLNHGTKSHSILTMVVGLDYRVIGLDQPSFLSLLTAVSYNQSVTMFEYCS